LSADIEYGWGKLMSETQLLHLKNNMVWKDARSDSLQRMVQGRMKHMQ
jgi:hypothetical protein